MTRNSSCANCLTVVLMWTALIIPAWAHPWYFPVQSQLSIINPYLSPQRITETCPGKWQNQLVLWEGTVVRQSGSPEKCFLELDANGQRIPVYFVRPVKNLQIDRRGYRVAIKGKVHLENHKFCCLYGLSVILLSPPPERSFAQWLGADKVSLSSYVAWRASMCQPKLERQLALAIGKTLVDTAKREHFDPLLFASLIQIESAFDPQATSVSGAQGLGQLMPFTASGLGVANAYDPIQNLRGSGHMVGNLFRAWENSPNQQALVLASYNAGPNLVRKLNGQVPHIPETVNYVYFIGFLRQMISAHTKALCVGA